MAQCKNCYGTGAAKCPTCNGKGKILGSVFNPTKSCSHCEGSGKVKCGVCKGKGYV